MYILPIVLKTVVSVQVKTTGSMFLTNLLFLYHRFHVSNLPFIFIPQVPCFYTDVERRSMQNATEIANLNCLRLLSDTTAGKFVCVFVYVCKLWLKLLLKLWLKLWLK